MIVACLVHDWGQPVKAFVVLAGILLIAALLDQRRRSS